MLYRNVPNAKFLVVSLGTGDRKDNLGYQTASGLGLVKWAKMLVPIFMDSVSEAVDYELRWIDPKAFRRFQYEALLPDSSPMDNASKENLQSLRRQALGFIKDNRTDLDQLCGELKSGRGTEMSGTGAVPSGVRH